MAINANAFNPRIADRKLFLAAAVAFPLIVLTGYFRSYYGSFLFDVPSVANSLVHAHGLIMSLWVVYFSVQVALIRTKNVKVHMTMGFVGIALAVLVVIVGMATAYDAQLVRGAAPPGINPHGFFILPLSDMFLFVVFFTGAIYFRKRPAEHKILMLMTAIAFLPAALFRLPVVAPENSTLWAFGTPALLAASILGWHTLKHGKLNKVFAASVALLFAAIPVRVALMDSQAWLTLVAMIAP